MVGLSCSHASILSSSILSLSLVAGRRRDAIHGGKMIVEGRSCGGLSRYSTGRCAWVRRVSVVLTQLLRLRLRMSLVLLLPRVMGVGIALRLVRGKRDGRVSLHALVDGWREDVAAFVR